MDECCEKAAKGVILINTELNTKRAVKNFLSWAEQRNMRLPDDEVPLNLLESKDAEAVCKCMCLFVLEACYKDGQPYPLAMLCSLLCELHRVLCFNQVLFSILDETDQPCPSLNTMDMVSSNLHWDRTAAKKKSASVIIPEGEEKMWLLTLSSVPGNMIQVNLF